jgi:ribosomal-protein-alanine N-acetyltransferase
MALERAAFENDAWPWIDVLAALTFPETVRLKASRAAEVVGAAFGDLRRHEDLGWIASIAIHPASRRRGIGRQLLAATEAALGTRRLRLTLRRSNDPARLLYESAGYVLIDEWPRYYRNGEDGLVMEKVRAVGGVTAW